MWLHIYMEDMSIPCNDLIPIGEVNFAAQIITYAGKIKWNVAHIATKMQACLKEHICYRSVHFTWVS